jgi:hypothetical protein
MPSAVVPVLTHMGHNEEKYADPGGTTAMQGVNADELERACGFLGDTVLDPEVWPLAMDGICRASGACEAALLQGDVRTPDIPRTASFDEQTQCYLRGGWPCAMHARRTPLRAVARRVRHRSGRCGRAQIILSANDDIRSSTGEVALDALLDLIEWCRSERSNLQRQLCALKSGKFRIGENSGAGWVDTTGASIERITASISELDQILAAYERFGKTQRFAR